MNKFLAYYFGILDNFCEKRNVDKREVKKFISEVERLPKFQCFDFIRLTLDNEYEHINIFELLWYSSMMNYVGTDKTTKDVILKLALVDLVTVYGESNLMPIFMNLDKIKLEEPNHKSINYNEIIKILKESDSQVCNLIGRELNTFLARWEFIAKQLIG